MDRTGLAWPGLAHAGAWKTSEHDKEGKEGPRPAHLVGGLLGGAMGKA